MNTYIKDKITKKNELYYNYIRNGIKDEDYEHVISANKELDILIGNRKTHPSKSILVYFEIIFFQ